MSGKSCMIEGCDKPSRIRGMCRMHHSRWVRHGDPSVNKNPRAASAVCVIEGCGRPHDSRGWCSAHWRRWRKYGDPLGTNKRVRGHCQFEGCYKPTTAFGLCVGHASQVRRGVPLAPLLRQPGAVCAVDGCGGPYAAKGMCETHYYRFTRTGRIDPPEPQRSERGGVTSNGYAIWGWAAHPLAAGTRKVLVHRAVLYDKIGPGSHSCHHCGREVSWDLSWPRDGVGALVVDHLDHDRQNNDPSNLVPSCQPCNVRRKPCAATPGVIVVC